MLLAVFLAGCAADLDCSDPATVVAEVGGDSLTCADAAVPVSYVELLASRPITLGERQILWRHVKSRFEADPVAARGWLGGVRAAGAALETLWGLAGAERRSTLVWESLSGLGPIKESDDEAWAVQSRALAVWARDDVNHLALTEADIEGWIFYASLCREAQRGGVLRLSVADRVTVYRMVVDRYGDLDREGQVALGAMGPFWPAVKDAWAMAPYELQQGWVAAAPLPPPMTATSLGYAEALLGGDLAGHARVLHGQLGPLPVSSERRFVDAE